MANMYNKIWFLRIFENSTIASLAAFSSYEVLGDYIRKKLKVLTGSSKQNFIM